MIMENIMIFIVLLSVIVPVLIIIAFSLMMYRKVPPNKALIVFGLGGRRVVVGGGTLVIPFLQVGVELSLEIRQLKTIIELYTSDNVRLNIQVSCHFKVDSSYAHTILKAYECISSKTEKEIENIVKEIIFESIRSVIPKHTFHQLNEKSEEIIEDIKRGVESKLSQMGLKLELLSLEIKN